jgi:segregation and condensation protein B
MEEHELKPIVEALLFVSGDPISVDRLRDVIGVGKEELETALALLQKEYAESNRGLQVIQIAGGYQLSTRIEMAPWIKEMEKIKAASRLSKPGLETLAIIAYKQPVTRGEIEMIRGVDAAGVLKTLMERKLVKIVGRKEVAGRPMMYGTTREFLQYFGLANLTGLPTLKEFAEVADAERDEAPAEMVPEEETAELSAVGSETAGSEQQDEKSEAIFTNS